MKAIEMNQALMEAIKTTEVSGASALEKTRALRQLVASANARIEALEVKAVEDAKARAMEQNGEDEGKRKGIKEKKQKKIKKENVCFLSYCMSVPL